ncbi:MAG TPA: hypothetical protein VGB24_15590 [Longimicrobium sp.]|jgi:peptidoglycan/LPS O-acetylase OafA/YrhL|uniref:hypothetical protein n=1 Tax=Longimicrobium sp. TaxID=2029185 RepID=UPI002EDA1D35
MHRIRFITDVNGSMKELPGPKKERPWDKKWVVEALNVVPAIGTAVVAALMAAADASRRPYFGILAGLAATLGMASIVKVLHARGPKELQNPVSVACAGISSFLPKAY